MEVYRIKDWDKNFEKSTTRRLQKVSWIPVPVKLNGYGLNVLVRKHPDGIMAGVAQYGIWMFLLETAATCEPRGFLVRNCGTPHTAETLAFVLGLPEDLVANALQRLVEDVKWIEVVSTEQLKEIETGSGVKVCIKCTSGVHEVYGGCTSCAPTRQDKTRQDTTEQDKTEQEAGGRAVEISAGEDLKPEIHREWTRIKSVVPIKVGRFYTDDRRELFKIATLRAMGMISDDVIEDTLESVRRKNPDAAFKFFRNGVLARANGAGINADDLIQRTTIPQWAVHLVEGTVAT